MVVGRIDSGAPIARLHFSHDCETRDTDNFHK
jgi:hypothetical protein